MAFAGQAISGGFAEPENRQVLIPEKRRVILEEGVYKLPFGELSVRIDPDEFRYGPFRMVNFVDTAELEVRGLRIPPPGDARGDELTDGDERLSLDPNLANNSSTVTSTVATSADLAVAKSGPATVTAGTNWKMSLLARVV